MSSTPDQSLSDPEEFVLPPIASFYPSNSDQFKPAKVQETPTDMTYITLNQSNILTQLEPMTPPQSANDLLNHYIKREPNLCSWKNLSPENWNSGNVMDFLYYLEEKLDVENHIRSDKFQNVDGKRLCAMPLDELQKRDPEFGQAMFDELNNLKNEGTKYFQNDPLDLSTPQPNCSSFLRELQTSDIEQDEYLEPLLTLSSPIPVGIDYSQFEYSQQGYINNNDHQHNYDYNPQDTFPEIIHQDESGYDSAASRCSSSDDSFEMPPQGVPIMVFQQAEELNMDHSQNIDSTQLSNLPGNKISTVPKPAQEKRRPGRPPNRMRSDGSESSVDDAPVIKKTRGRKVGQMSKAGNHLWEFIRDLLKDPQYNPGLIKWEDNEEGVFRIVKSAEVSRLWGKKKNNAQMNYEKLSRAMRHYYKNDILQAVLGRRLVYKFGKRATEWRPTRK